MANDSVSKLSTLTTKVNNMKINDRFRTEWDGFCWTLYESHTYISKKTGEAATKEKLHYYPTLWAVLHEVVNRSPSDSIDIKEALDKINKVLDEIKKSYNISMKGK